MYSDDIIPQESQDLWQECQQLIKEIFAKAPIKNKDIKISSSTILDFNAHSSIYILKEGILKELLNGNHFINHEPGDLVGLQVFLNNKDSTIATDFAVVVDEYSLDDFLYHIASSKSRLRKWHTYLAKMQQAQQFIICDLMKDEVVFQPEIRQYEPGQKIIHQGETDDVVYTLISGSASVKVGDTQVGEVIPDEIFGAIAALTGTERTADVVADEECMVMAVPADRFQDLLSTRPETVTKLIEDMARNIVSSNEQIVSLSGKT